MRAVIVRGAHRSSGRLAVPGSSISGRLCNPHIPQLLSQGTHILLVSLPLRSILIDLYNRFDVPVARLLWLLGYIRLSG